jgi:hypothetical protein
VTTGLVVYGQLTTVGAQREIVKVFVVVTTLVVSFWLETAVGIGVTGQTVV